MNVIATTKPHTKFYPDPIKILRCGRKRDCNLRNQNKKVESIRGKFNHIQPSTIWTLLLRSKLSFELSDVKSIGWKISNCIWAKTRSSFFGIVGWNIFLEFFMQNTEEKELGLMEFEKKLTHIFGGSGVSIIRNKRGIVRGPEREKGERGGKKKAKEEIRRKFSPRNFHIGNSYFNGGWIFHGKTGP